MSATQRADDLARPHRALALLKEVLRTYSVRISAPGFSTSEQMVDWLSTVRAVQELLAEESPGFDPNTGEQQQNCGALPFFSGAGPCEKAPGHSEPHSYRGRRWR